MVNKEIEFSLWLDFIERDYLKNEFGSLIEQGVINGATSNPAIFAAAITSSPAYKEQLLSLEGKSPKEKYEALAIEDIRMAAQQLKPLYEAGDDGFISIEVDPFLANDTEGTVAEGKRLYQTIGEPNVMVKVPATNAGYDAMRALMAEGISVNATLIFSPAQARRCLKAMAEGIAASSTPVKGVISVFVSRFDRMLDGELAASGIATGLTGIYNAAKIYNIIEAEGNEHIRTLFASTGVKGDDLPPYYYMRELLAPHSVNTAPLATIEAWQKVKPTPPALPIDDAKIDGYFTQLADNGFDMEAIYAQLLSEGLVAFEEAFASMLESLK